MDSNARIAVGAVTVLLVLTGLAWWMWHTPAAAATPQSDAADQASQLDAAPASTTAEGVKDLERVAVGKAEPAPTTAATTLPPDSDAFVELRGRIAVRDRAGVDHERLNGTFTLMSEHAASVKRNEIKVTDGQWSVRVHPDSRLAAHHTELGGKPAKLLEGSDYFDVPVSRTVELRARFANHVLLHVVDAGSHAELTGVDVRRRWSWRAIGDDIHPGDHADVETLFTNVASPIALPEPRLSFGIYWARAPGYGWSRIHVDHTAGGERTVELSRGAAVEVLIEGKVPDKAFVRMYRAYPAVEPTASPPTAAMLNEMRARPHGHMVEVRAALPGPTRIEDLAPGDYHACVETGEFESKRELGRAPVTLQADAVARVRVPLQAAAEPTRAPLRGTITAADEAALETAFELWLDRTEPGQAGVQIKHRDLKAVDGNRLRLAFDAGMVLPGDYMAYLTSLQHRVVFTVPAAGMTDLDIALPPSARALVRVVDARSGATIVPKSAQWCDGELPGVSGNMLIAAHLDKTTGELEVRTVAGEISLSVEHPDYLPTEQKLVLAAGDNQALIKMQPALGIRVKVQSAGATLPLQWQFWSKVKIEGAKPDLVSGSSRSDDQSYTQFVLEPGSYTVELPVLEGYRQASPQTVAVNSGVAEVVFELVRKER